MICEVVSHLVLAAGCLNYVPLIKIHLKKVCAKPDVVGTILVLKLGYYFFLSIRLDFLLSLY